MQTEKRSSGAKVIGVAKGNVEAGNMNNENRKGGEEMEDNQWLSLFEEEYGAECVDYLKEIISVNKGFWDDNFCNLNHLAGFFLPKEKNQILFCLAFSRTFNEFVTSKKFTLKKKRELYRYAWSLWLCHMGTLPTPNTLIHTSKFRYLSSEEMDKYFWSWNWGHIDGIAYEK